MNSNNLKDYWERKQRHTRFYNRASYFLFMIGFPLTIAALFLGPSLPNRREMGVYMDYKAMRIQEYDEGLKKKQKEKSDPNFERMEQDD